MVALKELAKLLALLCVPIIGMVAIAAFPPLGIIAALAVFYFFFAMMGSGRD